MTYADNIQRAILRAVAEAKKKSPYDTGNLRNQGVKYVVHSQGELRIYIDENEAPYMKYTNEPWDRFAPPLRGKKNPNQGWWGKAAEAVARSLARDLGGEIQ